MSLNVNRSVTDAFYRYKMPKLLAKVEGKGNGIKTVIVNMVEIAKALGRPPTYPTKYFGCELGAQTQVDFKDERFIVNGSHEANKLQDLLDGFIKKFVLCPECDNPETVLAVQTKKSVLSQTCKACGHSGIIKGGHRLITYIIKNPPSVNPATQGKSLTAGKRSKRSKKQNGEANGDDENRQDDENGLNDSHGVGQDEEDDDDDWGVDTSEEAVRARQLEDLSDGVKSLAVTEDAKKPTKDRMNLFHEFLDNKRKSGGKLDDKELLSEAERLDIREKAALILAELLFNQNILSQLKTHRVLLLRFCHENEKCQKYLLGGIEQVINLHKEQLLNKVAIILKNLYDLDIIDEEVLITWHANLKVNKTYVSKELSAEIRVKAEPFIKWLKEAEEEEEEDEEEDDVEIEYDDRARISSIQTKAIESPVSENGKSLGSKVDPDDDFDIDAI